MNYKFTNVLIFAVGAAVGSAVTWKIVKDRYERIVQEEIESVKEAFENLQTDNTECDEVSEDDESDTGHQINWDEYEDLDEEDDEPDEIEEYSTLASNYTSEKGGAEKVVEKPYVISPHDFGMNDDYRTVELTYYADGVLEDNDGNIFVVPDEVDKMVGSDSLYTFGEYEEDAVHVRNERLRTDFEILRDYRTYMKPQPGSPGQV